MSTITLKAIAAIVLSAALAVASFAATSNKKSPRRVGLVFDLTGKRASALDVIKGIEVAVAVLAKTKDLDIELEKYDSGGDGAGTRRAIQEMLRNPPDMVIAEIDSSKATIAAEMLEEAKRVMITPFATSPIVTQGRKYIFRACFADEFQGAQLANFAAKDIGAKRAAIFSDGSELYSQTLAKTFREHFIKGGGLIVSEEKILSSSVSFGPQLDSALAEKADVVFLPVYEQTAARFINEATTRGIEKLVFLGGDGWGASRIFKDIVFRKSASIAAYWVSHYSGDFRKATLKNVADNFRKLKGEDFNSSSAIGYDTMMVAGRAMVNAKGDKQTQTELADKIRALPSYQGVTGTIRYGGAQDPTKSLFIRKVDKDKMGFVAELKP